MYLNGLWRDSSPKMNLDGGYIGDRYPLCVDVLEGTHFLRKGATFRLLGSSIAPTLHSQPNWWLLQEDYNIKTLSLSTSSELYSKLCDGGHSGNCNFEPVITLDETIDCDVRHVECEVDDLRLIKVQNDPPIYYEYIRPPCVEYAFYKDAKTIQLQWTNDAMCANGNLPLAGDSCCEHPEWTEPGGASFCKYSVEKTTFSTSQKRCEGAFPSGSSCPWSWTDRVNFDCHYPHDENWFWTSPEACIIQAKGEYTQHISLRYDAFRDN